MEAPTRATRVGDDDADAPNAPREASYYASTYNDPRADGTPRAMAATGATATPRARWGLRGFVPPARLRVDGYAYAGAEDSTMDARARAGAHARAWPTMRAIDAREMVFADADGDADERDVAVATTREDARARRVTGTMSSRPSWTTMHAHGGLAV